jgi:hypothetical protein
MPLRSSKHKNKNTPAHLSLFIFDPLSLDSDDYPAAVEQLEGFVDETTVDQIVSRALEIDFGLEYVLSGTLKTRVYHSGSDHGTSGERRDV